MRNFRKWRDLLCRSSEAYLYTAESPIGKFESSLLGLSLCLCPPLWPLQHERDERLCHHVARLLERFDLGLPKLRERLIGFGTRTLCLAFTLDTLTEIVLVDDVSDESSNGSHFATSLPAIPVLFSAEEDIAMGFRKRIDFLVYLNYRALAV
jgi:hypothetical protein